VPELKLFKRCHAHVRQIAVGAAVSLHIFQKLAIIGVEPARKVVASR
jgi:hypothetical protein